MKKIFFIIFLFNVNLSTAQYDSQNIREIENQLELISQESLGLNENVKTEINVNNITLANFLVAISNVHEINMNVAPELNNISIVNNFSDVSVKDLLVYLCKEYKLTIDFTGNILSIKTSSEENDSSKKRIVPIIYDPNNENISIDAKEDKLYDVFKQIMDETGKNLVFAPGLENKLITAYILKSPFHLAMDKLAFSNNLVVTKSEDGFFVFKNKTVETEAPNNNEYSYYQTNTANNSNFYFKITDHEHQLLEVDFTNTNIKDIINDISRELNVDVFTATPLDEAGFVTFKATRISYEMLLTKIFEAQTSGKSIISNTDNQQQINTNSDALNSKRFTFKKEGNTYYFGTENQLSVREVAIIHLLHRSVELLSNPSISNSNIRNSNRNYNPQRSNFNDYNSRFDSFNNRNQVDTNSNQNFTQYDNKIEALVNILPNEVKQNLDIKIDYELNSFYVNGPSSSVKRFKNFIRKIDKPVPVILIEVMFIEVKKNSTIETGISWGIGDKPTTTKGGIFPETDITLDAKTINKVIGGFDGFGSFNLGKVVPNFFATIKAMENNGNLKIRSTPKLSTLNGHRAKFSNGQTSYYTITQRNIYGTDNPQTSEITNYQPIDAELGLTIKPLVSGDGQVTLDIFVVQSSFGERITKNAPPDLNSREFSSIIRVKDQDIVVLGGLEEQMTNNSGSGVPFLAKIPIIKWFFSKRKREAKKTKLTVLIKPTIIN